MIVTHGKQCVCVCVCVCARAQPSGLFKETIIKVALIKRVVASGDCLLDGNLPCPSRRLVSVRHSCHFCFD